MNKTEVKYKILFLGRYNDSEILSGPEKAAKRIFTEISRDSDALFIQYFFEGEKYSVFQKLFGYELSGKSIARVGLFVLLPVIVKFKPNLIHIITFERFAILAFIYGIFNKVKFVYNVHGIIKHEHKMRNDIPLFTRLKDYFIEGIFYKHSDRLLFLSDLSVKTAEKYYAVAKEKIAIVAHGTDEVFYKSNNSTFPDYLRIVFIGDIDRPEKGFDFFTEILNKLKVKTEVYIVSNTKKSLSINSNVSIYFTDKMSTPDYRKFLNDKNIIISTSSYEQFSISTLECMTAGLIPVVTNCIGLAAYIKDDHNGYTIEYGDAETAADILERLSGNPEKLKFISYNAKEIYNELSWETVSKQYKSIYNELLASGQE